MKKEKKIVWKRDVTDQLYKAVFNYVKKHNGTAVVMGGIALVKEGPNDFNYGIMVRCTGKLPEFPNKKV